MVAHGRMLKKEYREDVKVVFVYPCIAKKKESTDPRNFDSIDAVLNFNDIRKWMESERISIEDCGDVPFERLEPQVNQLYPVTGGIIPPFYPQRNRRTDTGSFISTERKIVLNSATA